MNPTNLVLVIGVIVGGLAVGLYFGLTYVPDFEEQVTAPFDEEFDLEKYQQQKREFENNPNATLITGITPELLQPICDETLEVALGVYCLNERPRYVDVWNDITVKNDTTFYTTTNFDDFTFNSTEYDTIYGFMFECQSQNAHISFAVWESSKTTAIAKCLPTAETIATEKQDKFQKDTTEKLDRILSIMESETTLEKCLDGVCTYSIYIDQEKFENAGISSVVMTKPSKVSATYPDSVLAERSAKYEKVCEENNGTYYILALTEFCVLDNRRFMEISHE